jgi:hypothetical protein
VEVEELLQLPIHEQHHLALARWVLMNRRPRPAASPDTSSTTVMNNTAGEILAATSDGPTIAAGGATVGANAWEVEAPRKPSLLLISWARNDQPNLLTGAMLLIPPAPTQHSSNHDKTREKETRA